MEKGEAFFRTPIPGIGWIDTGGTTKFYLRSSRDINSIAPDNGFGNFYEAVAVRSANYDIATARPKLTIEYGI